MKIQHIGNGPKSQRTYKLYRKLASTQSTFMVKIINSIKNNYWEELTSETRRKPDINQRIGPEESKINQTNWRKNDWKSISVPSVYLQS